MEEKDILLRFGNRVREIRKEQKLTQVQLAEKIDLSTNFIGMVERGKRNTTIDKMYKIIDALGVKPSNLFEEL